MNQESVYFQGTHISGISEICEVIRKFNFIWKNLSLKFMELEDFLLMKWPTNFWPIQGQKFL